MNPFANRGINRLALHIGLAQFAWCISGVFFGVYLLRQGLPPATIFLTSAAVLLLRLALRPLILAVVPRLGLKRTLTLGTVVTAVQYPVIGLVSDVGIPLGAFVALGALAGILYAPCFHTLFAASGDLERRGSQIGVRQLAIGVAAVLGPLLGGALLTAYGPFAAFGAASAVNLLAVAPLLGLADVKIARVAPPRAFAAGWSGALLFVSDGWMMCSAAMAWDIVMFRALQSRYDAFGLTLAFAALAGAGCSLAFGRLIDRGHTRHAQAINAAMLAAAVLARALCGTQPAAIVAVAAFAAAVTVLNAPALMTVFYNEAKLSPCPFRFQFVAEAGWDLGGAGAALLAAGFSAAGWPLQAAILLGLFGVALQAKLLAKGYRAQRARLALAPEPFSTGL